MSFVWEWQPVGYKPNRALVFDGSAIGYYAIFEPNYDFVELGI